MSGFLHDYISFIFSIIIVVVFYQTLAERASLRLTPPSMTMVSPWMNPALSEAWDGSRKMWTAGRQMRFSKLFPVPRFHTVEVRIGKIDA